MNKIKLSEIKRDKRYKIIVNGFDSSELNKLLLKPLKIRSDKGSDIISYLKRYYNMGDMICGEQGISGVKDEKSFLEYLQNRKSPGCDKIELFEI